VKVVRINKAGHRKHLKAFVRTVKDTGTDTNAVPLTTSKMRKMNKVKYTTEFRKSKHRYKTSAYDTNREEWKWMDHAGHAEVEQAPCVLCESRAPGTRHGPGHTDIATKAQKWYQVDNSLSVDFILRQLNPVHTHTPYFLKTQCSSILLFYACPISGLIRSGFWTLS
jgi:hypothetical protein